MNCWHILGIQPTADKTTIRHAYAEKTRECHPEENPQEFDVLHKAFQAAMQYARRNAGAVDVASQELPGFFMQNEESESVETGVAYLDARKIRIRKHKERAKVIRQQKRLEERYTLEEYTKQLAQQEMQAIVLGLGEQEQGQQFDFTAIDFQQVEEPLVVAEHQQAVAEVLSYEEKAWRNTPGFMESEADTET